MDVISIGEPGRGYDFQLVDCVVPENSVLPKPVRNVSREYSRVENSR